MTQPRALSTAADQLGATISGMKSRLNELETAAGSGDSPIGTIVDYIGTTAPKGWTLLDGNTIVNGRFLYPGLWNILPATMKSGNNIVKPNTQGRVTVGQAPSGTFAVTIGSTGGAETVTLSVAQMPYHRHGMDHEHLVASRSINVPETSPTKTALGVNGNAANTYSGGPLDPLNNTISKPNTDYEGGSGGLTQGHPNLQPYIVFSKIMKLI